MAEDVNDHECAPPNDDTSTVVFYTCPEDGRTWLRDREGSSEWREIGPENQ